MELLNFPDPIPSEVLEPVIVGSWVIAQQTPRLVTAAPPSPVMFPPLEAVVEEEVDTMFVDSVGNRAGSSRVTRFPYAVPILFTA